MSNRSVRSPLGRHRSRFPRIQNTSIVSPQTKKHSSPHVRTSANVKRKLLINHDSSAEMRDESDVESSNIPLTAHDVPPQWMIQDPIIADLPPTESSDLQQETAEECLPLLLNFGPENSSLSYNEYGTLGLWRTKHTQWLHSMVTRRLPSGFAALDASRPWMLYWCLNGLAILGRDVSQYRQSVVNTLRPIQNATGGFGGSQGQYSHLATTYAAILSLVMVGGEDLINRKTMWEWLGSLKQPEGDFAVTIGGERDVRGAFCAMVAASLLNLPLTLPESSPARAAGLETLTDGLAEWVSKCQTYEGGLGSAPGNEAHGAYTFCGLGCLCILGEPHKIMNEHLNLPSLVSWLAARQHAPEGGLAGRTNKLVDGCYSHWLGGCWSLVEAAMLGPNQTPHSPSLWSREGLTRYILCCCQGERGGLRDKPTKACDAYHSCYNLAGLSSTQHCYIYNPPKQGVASNTLTAAFYWNCFKQLPDDTRPSFTPEDRVDAIHPVYVIPWGVAERVRHSYNHPSDGFATHCTFAWPGMEYA